MCSLGKRIDDRCEIDHTRAAGELGPGFVVKISVLKHDVDIHGLPIFFVMFQLRNG